MKENEAGGRVTCQEIPSEFLRRVALAFPATVVVVKEERFTWWSLQHSSLQ